MTRSGQLVRRLFRAGAALGLFILASCGDTPTQPQMPPYIAIVSIFSSSGDTDFGREYTYRVTEISGTTGFDKFIRAAPTDTIIVPVTPATYRISVEGMPSYCRLPGNGSSEYYVLIPEGTNTAIVRYQVSCESQFTLTTAADGSNRDEAFIYQIIGAGDQRAGILGPADTLRIDDLVPGDYDVTLEHVAGNCVVTSRQGQRVHLTVPPTGGARVDFRIECSDEAQRPHLLAFASSYHDGTSGFLFRAYDPQGDIERYVWDITDCAGHSVLPEGGRMRRGLLQSRTAGIDTITVFGAIEPGLPDSIFAPGRCGSIRVADQYGNTTPVFEVPLGDPARPGPIPTLFNARFRTVAELETQLRMDNPAYAGAFVAARMRDGILGPADGVPDLGFFNAVGYEGTDLPIVPLGSGRPQYYEYYGIIVYLFDNQGNFTRLEDSDLFN